MEEVTISHERFMEMVAAEVKVNWKVKNLIEQHGGYERLPQNIKDLLDKRLGVTRGETLAINPSP